MSACEQHLSGSIQLLLLLLEDLVVVLVLLKLFLAAIQQQFAESHSGSRFVRGGHFQLDGKTHTIMCFIKINH